MRVLPCQFGASHIRRGTLRRFHIDALHPQVGFRRGRFVVRTLDEGKLMMCFNSGGFEYCVELANCSATKPAERAFVNFENANNQCGEKYDIRDDDFAA